LKIPSTTRRAKSRPIGLPRSSLQATRIGRGRLPRQSQMRNGLFTTPCWSRRVSNAPCSVNCRQRTERQWRRGGSRHAYLMILQFYIDSTFYGAGPDVARPFQFARGGEQLFHPSTPHSPARTSCRTWRWRRLRCSRIRSLDWIRPADTIFALLHRLVLMSLGDAFLLFSVDAYHAIEIVGTYQ
jgi:hypothetical protein